MEKFHALIIGGGGTGGALAHDLALRGLQVTLVERGEVTSGTTGRHHGLLHAGGRYAVKDKESAIECIEENLILKKTMPGSFEHNDGLFVALSDENVEYSHLFIESCEECGIPTKRLTREEALRLEPNLSPETKMAVQIPDASMDAMRLALRWFATAKHNGAQIKTYTEVISILKQGNTVTGARVTDHTSGQEYEIGADIVINAAGPWSGQIADMVGVEVPIKPSPGVMLAVRGRLCNMVINRLAPSGDGDIIVPQRGLSVVGTTSWVVEDPDNLGLPKDHVQKMYDEGGKLIPLVKEAPFRAAWAAARPQPDLQMLRPYR
jgi:glycerol-3-phosphate dehydrogenase